MLTPVELLLLLCRYFHGSELAVPALCCTPLTGLKRTLCEGSLFPSAPCSGLQGPVQLCSHRTAAGWQVLLWPYSGAVGTQLGNALGLTLLPQQQTFEDYISKRRKGRVPQRLRSCWRQQTGCQGLYLCCGKCCVRDLLGQGSCMHKPRALGLVLFNPVAKDKKCDTAVARSQNTWSVLCSFI